MRADLLAALECINWTEGKLDDFEHRLITWTRDNVYTIVKGDPSTPNKLLLAIEKEFLPLAFSVEAGAYLNTIRSSLDILASSLSARNGKPDNDKAYFPIFTSKQCMLHHKNGIEGKKWQWLSKTEQAIIKLIEPYPAGRSNWLCALKNLDNMRKHRRLLEVRIVPASLLIQGVKPEHLTVMRETVGANGETLLAILSPDAPEPKITGKLFFVSFNEASEYGKHAVHSALRDFARFARSLIALFDTPN